MEQNQELLKQQEDLLNKQLSDINNQVQDNQLQEIISSKQQVDQQNLQNQQQEDDNLVKQLKKQVVVVKKEEVDQQQKQNELGSLDDINEDDINEDDINKNKNKNENEIKQQEYKQQNLVQQQNLQNQQQEAALKQKEADDILKKQKEADGILKKQKEKLEELLTTKKSFFDFRDTNYKNTKIKGIVDNKTPLKGFLDQIGKDDSILLLSNMDSNNTNYHVLKKHHLDSVEKETKKGYDAALDEMIKNQKLPEYLKKDLTKDKNLKQSLNDLGFKDFSKPTTTDKAYKVAFQLLPDYKLIEEEDKKEKTKETVKIISSLIGKSKDENKQPIKNKIITSSEILSSTVNINDSRLKLLGYYYKDGQYIEGKAEDIIGTNLKFNSSPTGNKKRFIEAVGYKFDYETIDMPTNEVDKCITELKSLGWKFDEKTRTASFVKPSSYSEDSKKILSSFINRSLNAIEVSKSATEDSKGQPDTNIKKMLDVHKIVGSKTNDKQK